MLFFFYCFAVSAHFLASSKEFSVGEEATKQPRSLESSTVPLRELDAKLHVISRNCWCYISAWLWGWEKISGGFCFDEDDNEITVSDAGNACLFSCNCNQFVRWNGDRVRLPVTCLRRSCDG